MFKRYCNDLALDLIEWANIEEHEDRIKAVKIYRIAGSKEIAYRNWIKNFTIKHIIWSFTKTHI